MSSQAAVQENQTHSTATPIVECVPNFSEGRDRDKVQEIVRAMHVEGVHLLDWSLDPDHNRSVVTVAGAPEAVVESAVRGVVKAAELINLTDQRGEHPRMGSADVVPFVPVSGMSLPQCVLLARQAGMEIWKRCAVPVYFYEAAASRPDRVRLENVRRGEFEGLLRDAVEDSTRRPDIGGPGIHPTAGAAAVGARQFLIAYNIALKTRGDIADVGLARAVAKEVRASSGGLYGLKAMGVVVNGHAQVSMNVTDFRHTPVARVHAAVAESAARHGAAIGPGELIGLIPEEAFEPNADWVRQIVGFNPEERVLERRLLHPLAWP
ncbi:MAG TPA: glutamate formimidoyltransferase [Candidatus Aquilonibacter sp.]|nr:glutamate formimidoyltransferase [Candidatus Aquilonibacter sp.]